MLFIPLLFVGLVVAAPAISDSISACGNIELDQGCGVQKPCNVNTDCGATEICITACCDTKICYATDGCPNTVSPKRMFRKDALMGKRKELPPSFKPRSKAFGKASIGAGWSARCFMV
jgi:hypothetical protein